AFVVYEYVITLEQEILVVWRRELATPSILLIANRYCLLAYSIVVIVSGTGANVSVPVQMFHLDCAVNVFCRGTLVECRSDSNIELAVLLL
ncbi:hypothetical protein BC835DRAFT_1267827, partial [Cytidiella melzeri]